LPSTGNLWALRIGLRAHGSGQKTKDKSHKIKVTMRLKVHIFYWALE